ncbi:hypothetical protein BJ322DRAFT_1017491 [Thelephora terrestris]|uniref:Uncharacterized protein n=1 Tax=Thelephora terrestris TaxID=56493 RepID=A0A9P6HPC8_9AGAM|nr:hypothetical protein BJ322DRAFT_1017491 [Thelephora terrestris]
MDTRGVSDSLIIFHLSFGNITIGGRPDFAEIKRISRDLVADSSENGGPATYPDAVALLPYHFCGPPPPPDSLEPSGLRGRPPSFKHLKLKTLPASDDADRLVLQPLMRTGPLKGAWSSQRHLSLILWLERPPEIKFPPAETQEARPISAHEAGALMVINSRRDRKQLLYANHEPAEIRVPGAVQFVKRVTGRREPRYTHHFKFPKLKLKVFRPGHGELDDVRAHIGT